MRSDEVMGAYYSDDAAKGTARKAPKEPAGPSGPPRRLRARRRGRFCQNRAREPQWPPAESSPRLSGKTPSASVTS